LPSDAGLVPTLPADFLEPTEEDYEQIDEDAERCLTDLHFLVTEVLYRHDAHKYGPFHKWMCDTVGKAPGTRELWLLPRDHFKTTILTIGHAIQRILENPSTAILFISRKDDHALLWSDEIRRQFVFNPLLRLYFHETLSEITTMDQLGSREEWIFPGYKRVGGHRRREPTLTATGMKARKQSKHYNWVYPDDCMDIEDTTEVGIREIRQNWKDIIPLFDKDSGVIVPGTRKHYNDLYAGIMKTGVYKVRVRHGLESATETCTLEECSKYAEPHPAPDFKSGKPLCAERMTRKDYEAKLAECEIDPKSGVGFFYHEYMNIPFSPSDRVFQPQWFKKVDAHTIPPLRTQALAMDTAWKQEEHPTGYDYTVIVRGGWDDRGVLYILGITRSRTWTAKQGCNAAATQMKEHGIHTVITEKVGDISWHAFLMDECRTRGIPFAEPLMLTRGGGGVLGRRSKEDRIRATQGYFETGKVLFASNVQCYEEAVDEFCNLGKWSNDDIADAISMFFDERVIIRPQNRSYSNQQPALRPMPFEEAWRRTGFLFGAEGVKDPLGRYGSEGPAEYSGGRIPFPGNTQNREEGFRWHR